MGVYQGCRYKDGEFVLRAKLVASRIATHKRTKEQFDVAVFDNGIEILFPNDWEPKGFDVNFGSYYTCGWLTDNNGRHLFTCKPLPDPNNARAARSHP